MELPDDPFMTSVHKDWASCVSQSGWLKSLSRTIDRGIVIQLSLLELMLLSCVPSPRRFPNKACLTYGLHFAPEIPENHDSNFFTPFSDSSTDVDSFVENNRDEWDLRRCLVSAVNPIPCHASAVATETDSSKIRMGDESTILRFSVLRRFG